MSNMFSIFSFCHKTELRYGVNLVKHNEGKVGWVLRSRPQGKDPEALLLSWPIIATGLQTKVYLLAKLPSAKLEEQ